MNLALLWVNIRKKSKYFYLFCLVTQSCLTLCNPMDYIACQAPLSTEVSRQEYQSELPFPSPGALPDPGIKPGSPTLQTDALPSELLGHHWSSSSQLLGLFRSVSPQPHLFPPREFSEASVLGLLHQRVHQETLRSFHFPEFYSKTNR